MSVLGDFYIKVVLRRPIFSLLILVFLTLLALTQFANIKLDASADALLLKGDPALEFYRETSKRYGSSEFILLTWQPSSGELLGDESLENLELMTLKLRELPGVESVVTVLDVPLLSSKPLSLSGITSGEGLPTLDDSTIDRDIALDEFMTSPIYSDLLVSKTGDLTAVQINLENNEGYRQAVEERESLRKLKEAGALNSSEKIFLKKAEALVKKINAETLYQHGVLVERVRAIAAEFDSNAKIFVGGVPMIAADMVAFVESDLLVFGTAIILLMMIMLAIIFREVRWVVIPVTNCLITVTMMLGLLGFLDWRMTVISANFVAVLLVVSLAISIHLVVRYRELESLHPNEERYNRVVSVMQLMAVPCIYTGVTTIVAFISLVVSGLQPVIDFGWMMTVGIVIALIISFIAVPCLMLVWTSKEIVSTDISSQTPPYTMYFATFADRQGGVVLAVSGVLLCLSIFGISRLEVENRFIDYFKESTEIYQGMELLDSNLGGTIPLDIVIDSPISSRDKDYPQHAPINSTEAYERANLDFASEDLIVVDNFEEEVWDDFDDFDEGQNSFVPSFWFTFSGMQTIDAVHDVVDSRPETGKVLSLSTTFSVVRDILGDDIGGVELALVQKSLPEEINDLMVAPYFSVEEDQARVTVRVKETSESLRRDEFLKDLHRRLINNTGLAAEQFTFTGMLVLYNNVLQSLFRSQILTLGAVFFAILVMFWALFRSLSLALIAIAPNLLAAATVLGVMGFAGIPLDIMTITIAAIVVGIGVDNCIHYVYRFMREFSKDRDYMATMYRCHGSIGRALYYTTFTVIIGFSTLTLSNFNPSIYFGLLTVLAMAAAVLGALLLLPRLIIWIKPLGI
ncbi:MAG: MMPL family transporter [Halieaceae bacterium]|nr:MMPL family transporter [Halieaceae bacterium]